MQGDRYRHKKRGTTYEIVGEGVLQTDTPLADNAVLVVYRHAPGEPLWVRPKSEFFDGRFEPVTSPHPVPAPEGLVLETTAREISAKLRRKQYSTADEVGNVGDEPSMTLDEALELDAEKLEALIPPKTCRACGKLFANGDTCSMGGCPMGGDF